MKVSRGSLSFFMLASMIAVAAVAGVLGVIHVRGSELEAMTSEKIASIQAGPRVRTVSVVRSPPVRQIHLQGEARPFVSAVVYAKVSGYLKEVTVDVGDKVSENQVLASIDSPELDRQYEGAVADRRYKEANARRTVSLGRSGWASADAADLSQSNADVAQATVSTLEVQKSYTTLRAPFNGTVTARFADPGALIQSATNAQTTALPVVTISELGRLRIYIYVDQKDAPFVKVGDKARVQVPGEPNGERESSVARISNQLDSKTRTMLAEIDVDNRDGKIVSGSFVDVTVDIAVPRAFELPAAALVLRGGTKAVAVVDADRRIRYRPVRLVEDDGQKIRLAGGVEEGEKIALDLGEGTAEGAVIQPVPGK